MIAVIVTAVLAAAGAVSLAMVRVPALRRRGRPGLPIVGEVSANTLLVFGLVCFGLGYHVAAHAFAWSALKAPMGWALGVAALAVAGTLAADAMQSRLLADERAKGD